MLRRPVVERIGRLAGLVTLILVAYFVMPVQPRVDTDNMVRVVLALLVIGLLGAGMIGLLRRHVENQDARVDGLVLGIVVVVVVFAFGFYLLELHHPGQVVGLHTRVDALYYALSTLSTIGYGDVHAVGQVARIVVIAQVVFDLVFVGAAAGLLTSRLRAQADRRHPKP